MSLKQDSELPPAGSGIDTEKSSLSIFVGIYTLGRLPIKSFQLLDFDLENFNICCKL